MSKNSLNLPVMEFIIDCANPEQSGVQQETVFLSLIVPNRSGYLVEAGFLKRRLSGCELIHDMKDFSIVGQEVHKPQVGIEMKDGRNALSSLLPSVIGAIKPKRKLDRTDRETLLLLEDALADRLSYPWISFLRPRRSRIALIEARHLLGRRDIVPRICSSSANLAIDLIVLDADGHMAQKATDLREQFLAIDMTIDDDLPKRIVHALRGLRLPVDGITSFTDRYLVATAKAAEMMGLPLVMKPDSLAASTDKYTTRLLSTGSEYRSVLISTTEELDVFRSTVDHHTEYPMIVKPSQGKNSEGVLKVTDQNELIQVVTSLLQSDSVVSNQVIVEPYVSGPEIDANFVLLDGETLFSEVVDDFPSAGDFDTAALTADFHESSMLSPSGLPKSECNLVLKFVYEFLRKLGFSTGIFHVEARVRDSSMYYSLNNGVVDLHESQHPLKSSHKPPSTFLLEINARAPGQMPTTGTEFAYGIDFFGLQLLAALGDTERLRAMSQPFPRGAQAWTNVVFVPTKALGVFDGEDVFEKLRSEDEELMARVSYSRCMFRRGDTMKPLPDGSWPWVAWFVVWSPKCREDAVRLGHKVQDAISYEVI